MDKRNDPEQNSTSREIATIAIYPEQGKSHSSSRHLSALAAYTRTLLHALPEADRKRHVVLTNIKDQPAATFQDNGIEVREVWRKGTFGYAFQIINAVRAIPTLKLIHLQHEFNQFGGAITVPLIPLMLWTLRLILRKRIVITYHEVLGNEMLTPELVKKFCLPVPSRPARFLFKAYYRFTSTAGHMILVQHQKFSDRLQKEMGVQRPIRILPIGTETNVALADRMKSRAFYGYLPDEKVLLFFGTLDWRKGLDILIEAFKELPPHYRLLIGGGQPVRIKHRPEYQEWYRTIDAGIKSDARINHIGFVNDDDISTLFASSDLVVLPYVVPQMVSAVLNHAASYERPFIASNAFDGHADPVSLFPATIEGLRDKVIWSFNGHWEELHSYSVRYKEENSWTRSAALLSIYYADTLSA